MQTRTIVWTHLFLLIAGLFGVIVRFAPTILAGVPINDGAMFASMIQDIIANRFILPAVASYNHLGIPFAYPPLSLYAGALLAGMGVPITEIVRWLPALFSALAVAALYWFASLVLGSRSKAALAAALYALMPRSFSWYVMGGGLSRSLGIVFLLLTCGCAWQFFRQSSRQLALFTILCGSAAVLSHPETALHTAAASVVIWACSPRRSQGARNGILIGLGIVLIISPWWGTVIARHGVAPFFSALSTGAHGFSFVLGWLRLNVTQEPFVPILTVLGLAGMSMQLARRHWFLPAWLVIALVVEPRSGPAVAAIPLASLAAIGVSDLLVPGVASLSVSRQSEAPDWTPLLSRSTMARAFVGVLLLYSFFGAFAYDLSLARVVTSDGSRQGMEWAKANTPAGSKFVVLSGSGDPFADADAEWFPFLTSRTSINTVQGREWLSGSDFLAFVASASELQSCGVRGPDCVETWVAAQGLDFDYLFIRSSATGEFGLAAALGEYQLGGHYAVVFRNRDTAILGHAAQAAIHP